MNTISNDTRIALLCELAHNRVLELESNLNSKGNGTSYICSNYNNDGTKYTEKGQDLFNEFYDYYEGVLLGRLKLVDDPNYN